jgi:hypothetical protein
VNGRIRDIGQNVLQFAFETGSSSSPQLQPYFVLIAFLEEVFITNIIITLFTNYTSLLINNNAVINNNLYKIPRFYFLLKISKGTRKGFFKI